MEARKTHEDPSDYTWDNAAVTTITLSGTTIKTSGQGVTVNGSIATITAPGTYSLSGSLNDGQIIVYSSEKGTIRLILNGVDLKSSTSAPIYIKESKKTVIILADHTRNSVSDGKTYVFEVQGEDEPNAAIFSKSDLTITGNGSLSVTGNCNDGIASKDGLIIKSSNITVNAVDDGIRGKDYLVVKDGTLTVNAKGDGVKSDNEEDPTQGFILIEKGTFNITSGGDAITAQTDLIVQTGTFTLTTAGGSSARIANTTSAKGLKGITNVIVDGGIFIISSADDSLHSNNNVTVNGGTFNITTGDDGMHADTTLVINGGDIRINKSYEGLESAVITINGGEIHVVASDDGINVAGGKDASGANPGMPPGGGRPGGRMGPGQDAFAGSTKYSLSIRGGYIVVDAMGDGVDANGAIEMSAGTLIVVGPTARNNSAIDYDASFKMSGGFLVAAGSSGMAQAPGETSSQNSLLLNLTTTQKAGTVFQILNSKGENILTFTPSRDYQSIAFSAPSLVKGVTYDVLLGGTPKGTLKDGIAQEGIASAGTRYTSFTVSGVVTRIGSNIR